MSRSMSNLLIMPRSMVDEPMVDEPGQFYCVVSANDGDILHTVIYSSLRGNDVHMRKECLGQTKEGVLISAPDCPASCPLAHAYGQAIHHEDKCRFGVQCRPCIKIRKES